MRNTYFGNIVLQSKDDNCDWRAFVNCKDSTGRWWELRGYGDTAAKAAQSAWDTYAGDEADWDASGYPVEGESPMLTPPAEPLLSLEKRDDLVTGMCMTMRHDFGLDKDPESPLTPGMTPAERGALRKQMEQLVDHHLLPESRGLKIRHSAFAGVPVDTASLRERMGRLALKVDPRADLEKHIEALAFQVHLARALIEELAAQSKPAEAVVPAETAAEPGVSPLPGVCGSMTDIT